MRRWRRPANWKAGSAGAPTSCARNWWPRPRACSSSPRRPRARSAPPAPKPRYGGRKMQEQLRALREQWKQTDQGGVPNHALWKRFDDACNEAYKVVEAWLDKVKAEAAEHKAQRLALIEEVKAWAAENPTAQGRRLEGLQPHPAPVRRALARRRAPEREGLCRTAAAVEGGDPGRRRAAGSRAEAEPGAPPRHDRRGPGARRRAAAAHRRRQGLAATLAGRGAGHSAGPQARAEAVGRVPQADRRGLQPQERGAREGRGAR